jgi:nucleotide-binding universal stress UspA family protein
VTVFSRIVVGTDGSDSASRAVDHAVRLASRVGAELVVVHAQPKPQAQGSETSDRAGPRERGTAAYDIGRSILRDASTWFGDVVTLRPVLRQGEAASVILDVAAQEDADLIVVGNRGMGTRRLLIGNVPGKVAHRAPCHVLVAQTALDASTDEAYRRVLLATDGSPTAARATEVGGALARATEADVLILHVGEPSKGREVLARAAEGLPGAEAKTVTGEPASRIVEVAGSEGCDLVVVGNKGMTGARRFLGSVPSKVARRAPSHTLLVKTT